MRIVIFTDEPEKRGGWHGEQLAKAFAVHNVEAVFVSLQDCVIDLSAKKPTIQIPHFETLPKAAFVRGIAEWLVATNHHAFECVAHVKNARREHLQRRQSD